MRVGLFASFAFSACLAFPAFAKAADDGGGRDVTIALFSTRALHSVTVSAEGSTAWTASCATCTHRPLISPIHLPQVHELYAGGPVKVKDDATGDERFATGAWHLRKSGPSQEIDVVLTIPSERYVRVVLNAEAAVDEPLQSLRALAVIARTYALQGNHFHAQANHLPAELCDSTQCQAMRLGPVSRATEDAVRQTAGETLWSRSSRAEVFFSQACGGQTEDAGAVWPALAGTRYLKAHADPYCIRRDKAMWHAEISLSELSSIAQVERWKLPVQITSVQITQRSTAGRALRIQFIGADGSKAFISASALRFGVGRNLGWNRLRSDWYEIGLRSGRLIFDGRGYGHGVGLCQIGAAEMASEGKSYREILAFYFPGTEVRIQPADQGWQQIIENGLTLRAADHLLPEQTASINQTWDEARQKFPTQAAVHPQIIFAPTTEVFRQLTSMPGWALASTQGNTIVLQPYHVLRAHGPGATTVLHEMLHVLVEAESTPRGPLWLREGLVEILAEGRTSSAPPAAVSVIESGLQNVTSQIQNERAHRQASALVQKMIDHYGISAVRGWLVSGVPSDVLSAIRTQTPNNASR